MSEAATRSSPETPLPGTEAPPAHAWLWLLLISLALAVVRLTGPPHLLDNDQERPAAYLVDACKNGHWICQRDFGGGVASKPPVYTWFACGFARLFGQVSALHLYLPTASATLLLGWLAWWAGGRRFGWRAGFLAALAFLISPMAAKHMALARTDALFACLVGLGALAAFRAWQGGRGWTLFWLAAAAATLTKGPLGVALAAGGLLAAFWERRSGHSAPLKGSHLPGIALYFILCGGWFYLAWLDMGQALIDKMIGKELVGHVMQDNKGMAPGSAFYLPWLYFLARFAPWSLFAIAAVWRAWRRPAEEADARRFERFLVCWLVAGLVLFSIGAAKRPDHLHPLMLAAALLAGRELARLTAWLRSTALLGAGFTVACLGLAGFAFEYHGSRAKDPLILANKELWNFAEKIRVQAGLEFPLMYVDTPYALQFYQNTLRPPISLGEAARYLQGEASAFIAVTNWPGLRQALGVERSKVFELARCEMPRKTPGPIYLVSNHPRLEWTDHIVCRFGSVEMELKHVRSVRRVNGDYLLESSGPTGTVVLKNMESNQVLRVRLKTEPAPEIAVRPGQTTTLLVPGTARFQLRWNREPFVYGETTR